MNERTHLDLFSGIGGFALAAQWTGWKTIAFSEIEPYACKVLKRHWPDVPNLGDIRNVRNVRADLITGGFPCQPFSVAGKRAGAADNRHLWPEMCRVIGETRPTWVLGENVPGIIGMELDRVLSDLENLGYACWPVVVPACAVDARHRRDRVWIVAYTGSAESGGLPSIGREKISKARRNGEAVADADKPGPQGRNSEELRERGAERIAGAGGASMVNSNSAGQRHARESHARKRFTGEGESNHRTAASAMRWLPEPGLGGTFDGLSRELDAIGGLNETTKARAREELRALWCPNTEEAFQWALGRFQCVSAAEILLAFLCELHEGANGGCIAMASRENARAAMRGMWRHVESARSPHRRKYLKQPAIEYSDALRKLSRNAPSCYPEAWAAGCWEDGSERVAGKIPNRAHRLKGLGNAIVPQVAAEILKAMIASEEQTL